MEDKTGITQGQQVIMAKTKAKQKSDVLDIVGQKVGGSICKQYIQFGELIVVIDTKDKRKIIP